MSRAAVIADDPDVLVAGGLAAGDVSTASVIRIHPNAGTAAPDGKLQQPVHDTGGARLHGQAYVFGGGGATTVNTVQRLGVANAASVAHLPEPRSDLSVVTSSDTAYIVGGFDGRRMDPDVLATTDGTTFRVVGTLAVPVRYAAVAIAAGALWVIGGQLSTSEAAGPATQTDAIQRMDLASGAVSVMGHLPARRAHASAFTLNGGLYVAGGMLSGGRTSDISAIDTEHGTVTDAGSLPGPRSDTAAVEIADTVWLIGGEATDPAHPLDTVVQLRSSA